MQQTHSVSFIRTLIEIVLLALLYIATARLCQIHAISPGNVSPVWIPSGIILAAVLVRGSAIWPGIWLGAFVGNVWAYLDWEDFSNLGVSFISGLANGLGDTLFALVSAQLILKFAKTAKPFNTIAQVTLFIIFGAAVGSAISAIFGVTGLAVVGLISWNEYSYVWTTWWVGDGVGVLLVSPLLLTFNAWLRGDWVKRTDFRELVFYLVTAFFVAALSLDMIEDIEIPLPLFMVLPVLLWGVVRFDRHIAIAVSVAVAVLSIVVTLQGKGPFAHDDINNALIQLQLFLATILSTVLLMIGLLTERASMEQGLKQTEERYRRLFDKAAGGIIVTDEKGCIESFNERAEKIFGYQAMDVIGRNVSYLTPTDVRDNHSQYIANSQPQKYVNVVGKDRAIMARHRDGHEFPIHIKISELVDNERRKFMAVVEDISSQKNMESDLAVCQKIINLLKGATFDALLIIRNNIVESVNPQFENLFGYEASELVRQSLKHKLFTTDLIFVEGQNEMIETEAIQKHGRRFPVVVQQRTRHINDELIKVISIRDISLQDKQQKELKGAQAQLINAKQAKSKFLSSMSHELRTPMNAIVGFAQLLEMSGGDFTERQKESIAEIRTAGKQLLGIIDDIMDMAKIEAGQFTVNMEEVNCTLLVSECVEFINKQAVKRGIKIFNHFGETENYLVNADPFRLKQVLLNLLSNAVKFNHADGTVSISAEPTTNNRLRISVTDSGVGLTEEEQAQVFEPFGKIGSDMAPVKGPGIGLVITKSLVELMGGEIGLESYKYMGSTFWIELELLGIQEIVRDEYSPEQKIQAVAEEISGKKILYIDNDTAQVRLVNQLVERLELGSLLTAKTGALGLDIAKDKTPDLILLELDLPGMDCFDLIEEFKKIALLAKVPIVVLSSEAREEITKRLNGIAGVDFIPKPIDLDRLSELLIMYLKNGNTNNKAAQI